MESDDDDGEAEIRVHRSCRLGSFDYADKHGVHGCRKLLTIKHSSICDGVGLFATRFIPRGTPITRYHGRFAKDSKSLTPLELAYTYMIAREGRKRLYLVGARNLARLAGRGLGQFANDAIHLEITGLKNNCVFRERGTRVYLAAKRDIAAGEELLVSYHISYWIGATRAHDRASRALPAQIQFWAGCHREIEDLLQAALERRVDIEWYYGMQDSDSLKTDDLNEQHGACVASVASVGSVGIVEYQLHIRASRGGGASAVCSEVAQHCACLRAGDDAMVRWQVKLEYANGYDGEHRPRGTRVSVRCKTCEESPAYVFAGEVPSVRVLP